MNAASPTLCVQLEKVSGWRATDDQLVWAYFGKTEPVLMLKRELYRTNGTINPEVKVVPAFDLGYVMRKLPPNLGHLDDGDNWLSVWVDGEPANDPDDYLWWAEYGPVEIDRADYPNKVGGTPEDAAVKLTLALFEQGVLKWSVPA